MLTTSEVAGKLKDNLQTIAWYTWRTQQLALNVVSILSKHREFVELSYCICTTYMGLLTAVIKKSFAVTGVLSAVWEKLEDDDWDIQKPAIDTLKMMAVRQGDFPMSHHIITSSNIIPDDDDSCIMTSEVVQKHISNLKSKEPNEIVAAISVFGMLADKREVALAVPMEVAFTNPFLNVYRLSP